MLVFVRITELKEPDEAIKRLLHETFLLRLDQAHLMIKKSQSLTFVPTFEHEEKHR